MKSLSLSAVALFVLAVPAVARAGDERTDVDPVLRGVVKAYAFSNDGGDTLQKVNGVTVARVSATSWIGLPI